jgi:hypothetical protein
MLALSRLLSLHSYLWILSSLVNLEMLIGWLTQVGVGDFHPDHEVVAVDVSNPFILHLFLLKHIWVCELGNYSGLVPSSLVFPDISDTGSRGEGFSEFESTSVKVSRKLALWWWRQIHFPKCCVWKNLNWYMISKNLSCLWENTIIKIFIPVYEFSFKVGYMLPMNVLWKNWIVKYNSHQL